MYIQPLLLLFSLVIILPEEFKCNDGLLWRAKRNLKELLNSGKSTKSLSGGVKRIHPWNQILQLTTTRDLVEFPTGVANYVSTCVRVSPAPCPPSTPYGVSTPCPTSFQESTTPENSCTRSSTTISCTIPPASSDKNICAFKTSVCPTFAYTFANEECGHQTRRTSAATCSTPESSCNPSTDIKEFELTSGPSVSCRVSTTSLTSESRPLEPCFIRTTSSCPPVSDVAELISTTKSWTGLDDLVGKEYFQDCLGKTTSQSTKWIMKASKFPVTPFNSNILDVLLQGHKQPVMFSKVLDSGNLTSRRFFPQTIPELYIYTRSSSLPVTTVYDMWKEYINQTEDRSIPADIRVHIATNLSRTGSFNVHPTTGSMSVWNQIQPYLDRIGYVHATPNQPAPLKQQYFSLPPTAPIVPKNISAAETLPHQNTRAPKEKSERPCCTQPTTKPCPTVKKCTCHYTTSTIDVWEAWLTDKEFGPLYTTTTTTTTTTPCPCPVRS